MARMKYTTDNLRPQRRGRRLSDAVKAQRKAAREAKVMLKRAERFEAATQKKLGTLYDIIQENKEMMQNALAKKNQDATDQCKLVGMARVNCKLAKRGLKIGAAADKRIAKGFASKPRKK